MSAGFTPGPWFVSGVRFRMNGGEWHNVNRYNEALKRDDNIACIGFDPRTGDGLADARLIAAAPALYEALDGLVESWRAPDGSLPRGPKCVRAYAALKQARGEA